MCTEMEAGSITTINAAIDYFRVNGAAQEASDLLAQSYQDEGGAPIWKQDVWTGSNVEMALRLELLRIDSLRMPVPLRKSREYYDAKMGTHIVGGVCAEHVRLALLEQLRLVEYRYIFEHPINDSDPINAIRILFDSSDEPAWYGKERVRYQSALKLDEMIDDSVRYGKEPLVELEFVNLLYNSLDANLFNYFNIELETTRAWGYVYRDVCRYGEHVIAQILEKISSVDFPKGRIEWEKLRLMAKMEGTVQGMMHGRWMRMSAKDYDEKIGLMPPGNVSEIVVAIEREEKAQLEASRKKELLLKQERESRQEV